MVILGKRVVCLQRLTVQVGGSFGVFELTLGFTKNRQKLRPARRPGQGALHFFLCLGRTSLFEIHAGEIETSRHEGGVHRGRLNELRFRFGDHLGRPGRPVREPKEKMRLGGIRLESEDLLELLDGFLDAIPPENTIGPTRLSRSRIDGCDAAACAIAIALGGGVHTQRPLEQRRDAPVRAS